MEEIQPMRVIIHCFVFLFLKLHEQKQTLVMPTS